jgi:transcriptional regulator with XRE-family HTH domain
MTRQSCRISAAKREPPFRILDSIVQGMARRARNLTTPDSVAERLALTREILGLTQKEFAVSAGMILSRYNLREAGKIPLPLSGGIQLCDAYGLTLDWLYRGNLQGLPIWLAVELLACSVLLAGAAGPRVPAMDREASGDSSTAADSVDEHPAFATANPKRSSGIGALVQKDGSPRRGYIDSTSLRKPRGPAGVIANLRSS